MPRNDRIQQNRRPTVAKVLLLYEVLDMISNNGIPIITALFAAAQIGLFLGYIQVTWNTSWDVCLSVDKLSFSDDKKRLIMSAFEHSDDWHLYYNVVSFLWKGRELETYMGRIRFLLLLIMFVPLTSFSYLGINLCLFYLTNDEWYLKSCTVGLSGVIFALKVLTTHYTSSRSDEFLGISVPLKYTYWVELIIIQIIAPKASLIGHLSGILVGLMYVAGPLKKLLDFVEGILVWILLTEEIQVIDPE